jgi:pyruvate/2-oxoglutarate/acetoin dehydrogenase E1 component
VNTMEAMAIGLADLLRDDPRRVLLGEDVASGGMLGWSRACVDDPELRARVVSTPLMPATMAAHAGGLALAGLRPIVLLPSAAALIEGLAGLREIGLVASRTGGDRSAPVLFVAPCGPGFGLGDEGAIESTLARQTGVRVLSVGRASDVVRRLADAAAFADAEDPTVLLVPRLLLGTAHDDAPPVDATSAVERARDGRTITVFTWGEALAPVLEACDDAGIDAAVIDVVRLAPLDRDALVEHAKDTGRVAIVHAGERAHGLGAEIAALVAEHAIYYLDAPVLRLCGDDGVHAPADEMRCVPTSERIAAALADLASP